MDSSPSRTPQTLAPDRSAGRRRGGLVPHGTTQLALRAACDVLAATVTHGRAGFLHRVPGAWINQGLAAAMENLDAKTRERLPKLLELHWPKVLHDPDGDLWVRDTIGYRRAVQATAYAVDDQSGQVYFVSSDRKLYEWTAGDGPQPVHNVGEVVDVQASRGVIYGSRRTAASTP